MISWISRGRDMVFCFGEIWSKLLWPCSSKSGQGIIRTAYLKSYETVVSEEDSTVANEERRSKKKKSRSRKAVRTENTDSAAEESESLYKDERSSSRKHEKDKHKRKSSKKSRTSIKKSRGSEAWIDEYGASDEDKRSKKENSAMKRRRRKNEDRFSSADGFESDQEGPEPSSAGAGKSGKRGDSTKKKVRSHLDGDRFDRGSSKAANISKNKTTSKDKRAEILEKYKSRAYSSKGKRREREEGSDESRVDSSANADSWALENSDSMRKDIFSNNRSIREMKIFKNSHVEDSESEINFIVDLYDKTSFNNNLREKMFEYLKQMGKEK